MNKNQVITAVASSILTALLVAGIGIYFDAFEKKLSEVQVSEVANELAEGPKRDLLIDQMARGGKFKGDKGDPGPKGDQGIPSSPTNVVSTFSKLTNNGKNKSKDIPESWEYCSISTASYYIDAYIRANGGVGNPICSVKEIQPGNKWVLSSSYAICTAECWRLE